MSFYWGEFAPALATFDWPLFTASFVIWAENALNSWAQAQRILSVPFKRTSTREIQHLDLDDILAVLRAVDPRTSSSRRDLALLSLMFNTGARVSEIAALQTDDLQMTPAPSVVLHGKGRKERICPLWPETVHLLEKMLEERSLTG
jgi:integrase